MSTVLEPPAKTADVPNPSDHPEASAVSSNGVQEEPGTPEIVTQFLKMASGVFLVFVSMLLVFKIGSELNHAPAPVAPVATAAPAISSAPQTAAPASTEQREQKPTHAASARVATDSRREQPLSIHHVQDNHYVLTWKAVPGAVSYHVYVATNQKMENASLAQSLESTSYSFSLHASPSNVWMAVAPVDHYRREGSLLRPISIGAPSLPKHVKAHHLYDQEYSLTWDSMGAGITYHVYYANNENMQDATLSLFKPVDGTSYRFTMTGDAAHVWMAVAPLDADQHEGPLTRPINIGQEAATN